MCSACAMTAMAGATGLRAWIALRVPALASPRLMRAVTITVLGAGVLLASVSLQGSGGAKAQAATGPGSVAPTLAQPR